MKQQKEEEVTKEKKGRGKKKGVETKEKEGVREGEAKE